MDTMVKGAAVADEMVLTNPKQKLTAEVTKALSARRKAHGERLALQNQADLDPDFRKRLLETRRSLQRSRTAGEAAVSGFEGYNPALSDILAEKNTKVATRLKDRAVKWKDLAGAFPTLPVWPRPVKKDPSFWWSETWSFVAPDTRASFHDDGLRFLGGPKVNDYDGEMHTSFGAVARFCLSPDRRPKTPSGWYRSAPHVELFGGVVAYAPDWDLIQGNGIASCNISLRHTLFQWKFGPDGPVAGKVAEATVQDPWRIYLKNTGYSRHAAMPGFKPLPALDFHQSQMVMHEDLWAEVEVRFDIYLNTTGALVWCDPNVLLRTFQWPLVAV
ncbi:hypothetical protein [Aquamicrobium sp. LC103]|uniref:hypothetical protein n=1 Tax=Aquamicrobium sp. LC103 TaxID=1120658 RepID=UPI00063E9738|nr:hypothetical protein [Aquamicrobium sp. LC103]TKT80295.1 hypothetical protein XW59_008090 [Aquamicrobium sp. LC103]